MRDSSQEWIEMYSYNKPEPTRTT